MAKKTNEPKKAPKKNIPATPAEEATVVVEQANAQVVNPSQMTPQNMVGHTASKLDANHRVELLGLAKGMFHDDPAAETKYGATVVAAMDKITACGIIAAMADEAHNGDSTFATVLQANQYPLLVAAAQDMGIKLPELKQLPAGKEEGTVTLPGQMVEEGMSQEAKTQVEEEAKVAAKADEVEIDPVKVVELGTDEALVSALKVILIPNSRSKTTRDVIMDCIDFMKAFRIAQAMKAGDSEEAAKAKYENHTAINWLNDAFSYVTPTFIFNGIGKGLVDKTIEELAPVSAFVIMKNAMNKRIEEKDQWDDQMVAEVTKAIILWKLESSIKAEKKALEALNENDKNNKDVAKAFEKKIAELEEARNNTLNPKFDIIDTLAEVQIVDNYEKPKNKTVFNMFQNVAVTYYGKDILLPTWKNKFENVQQRAGIIANMFREADNKNQNYNEANLTELVEMTEEERAALAEKHAQMRLEARKAAAKKA